MVLQSIDILFKKALIEPKRTDNPSRNIQFFFYFPDDSIFCRLAQADAAAGQIKIWRALIMHC